MKIGVVHRKNSFSKHWIKYLKESDIVFSKIDPFAPDAMKEMARLDYLFWHIDHFDPDDALKGPEIIEQLESKVHTFPNQKELEYFDNKIRQIELFEKLKIKHPTTHIDLSREAAISSSEMIDFPFVAKLKKGAGSDNVWLIKNKKQALAHIERSFSSGFSIFNQRKYLRRRMQDAKSQKSITEGIKGIRGVLKNKHAAGHHPKEKGYTFFQRFIPNDGYDIRVVVIGQNKAFSARRDAKKGDWTASGSGIASYPNETQDIDIIKVSFSISEKLNARCVAIDFIKDKTTNEIFAIEISPFYASYSMRPCTGYWDNRLNWHVNERDPQWFLVEDILSS